MALLKGMGKKNLNLKNEIDNCKISLHDIINDFKILHIDTSECGAAKYEIANELINFVIQMLKKIINKFFLSLVVKIMVF